MANAQICVPSIMCELLYNQQLLLMQMGHYITDDDNFTYKERWKEYLQSVHKFENI